MDEDNLDRQGTYVVLPSTSNDVHNSNFKDDLFEKALREIGKSRPLMFDSWTQYIKSKIALDTEIVRLKTTNFYDELTITTLTRCVLKSKDYDVQSTKILDKIRNSLAENDLPPVSALRIAFVDIFLARSSYVLEVDDAAYEILDSLVTRFPPASAELRYYWLALFLPSKSRSEKSRSNKGQQELDMSQLITELRSTVFSVFSSLSTGSRSTSAQPLLDFLVKLLEFDLYYAINVFPDPNSQTVTNSRNIASLKNVPLSYILFFDPHERRKRNIGENGITFLLEVVQAAANQLNNPIMMNLCFRLFTLCFEMFRWFHVKVTKEAIEGKLTNEMREDMATICRRVLFISPNSRKGTHVDAAFSQKSLKALIPFPWIQEIFDSCSPYSVH